MSSCRAAAPPPPGVSTPAAVEEVAELARSIPREHDAVELWRWQYWLNSACRRPMFGDSDDRERVARWAIDVARVATNGRVAHPSSFISKANDRPRIYDLEPDDPDDPTEPPLAGEPFRGARGDANRRTPTAASIVYSDERNGPSGLRRRRAARLAFGVESTDELTPEHLYALGRRLGPPPRPPMGWGEHVSEPLRDIADAFDVPMHTDGLVILLRSFHRLVHVAGPHGDDDVYTETDRDIIHTTFSVEIKRFPRRQNDRIHDTDLYTDLAEFLWDSTAVLRNQRTTPAGTWLARKRPRSDRRRGEGSGR